MHASFECKCFILYSSVRFYQTNCRVFIELLARQIINFIKFMQWLCEFEVHNSIQLIPLQSVVVIYIRHLHSGLILCAVFDCDFGTKEMQASSIAKLL